MNFNNHSQLVGQHAFLSASNYHWLNYSAEQLITVYNNQLAKLRGTELHAFAEQCILLGQKLPRSKKTLNMYVNDAIGYKMRPEQVLFYSPNCFGTADSICFRNDILRIHDLKTGVTPASMNQLLIYDAIFCLEYKIRPGDIKFENRIYQSDEVNEFFPEANDILPIMDTIVRFDKLIEKAKEQEG